MSEPTVEDLQREYGRFHMACRWCGQVALPQLMPGLAEVYVGPFLKQHRGCREIAEAKQPKP